MAGQRLIRFVTLLIAGCAAYCSVAAAQIENGQGGVIPSGPYRIAGTAVNAKAGGPLARARVSISDSKHRQDLQSFITADDGRFEFHVPAGKYELFAAKRGYIAASYNQHEQFSTAIVTGADLIRRTWCCGLRLMRCSLAVYSMNSETRSATRK